MRRMKFNDFFNIFIKHNSSPKKTKVEAIAIMFGDRNICPSDVSKYCDHEPSKTTLKYRFFEDDKHKPITIDDMNKRLRMLGLINTPSNGEEMLANIDDEYYFDSEFISELRNQQDSTTCLSLLFFDIYNHYDEAKSTSTNLDLGIDEPPLSSYPIEKLSFLKAVNNDVNAKTSIYFAFHYGMHFFTDKTENEILRDNLLNKGAHLKMILNSASINSTTLKLSKKIRNKNQRYFDPLECLLYWSEFMNEINNESKTSSMEIRVCDLPLMHKVHIFFRERNHNLSWGAANISYYCYGEKSLENNHVYMYSDEQFRNLKDEFEYLFDNSTPILQYLNNLSCIIPDIDN